MKAVKLVVSIILVSQLMVGSVAIAQESTATTRADSVLSAIQPREKRIKERKDKSQSRIAQSEKTIVRGRCQSANIAIKNAQTKIDAFREKKKQAYTRIVNRLQASSSRFKEAGIDTATYSQQIAELKSKVDMFAIEVDSLKLVVDDLVNMDCATDPEGFVVSLREAKILRQNVLQKSQNFRQYLSASIRPTLTKIRSELLSKPHSTNKEFNRL